MPRATQAGASAERGRINGIAVPRAILKARSAGPAFVDGQL
jgi:hypothetical protein